MNSRGHAGPSEPPGGLLAPDDERRPSWAKRWSAFLVLFIPWLILYESVISLGPPPNAFQTYFLGETNWPIYQWSELLYFSPYVLVAIIPLIVPTNRLLRRFTVVGILGTVLGHLLFLIIRANAVPRPFEPQGLLGAMMVMERKLDMNNGTGALPSFHVFWVFLGAVVFAAMWPRLRHLAWLWAVAVSLSCVFTGVHSVVDIVAGFGLYLVTWSYPPIWPRLHRSGPTVGLAQSHPTMPCLDGALIAPHLASWRWNKPFKMRAAAPFVCCLPRRAGRTHHLNR